MTQSTVWAWRRRRDIFAESIQSTNDNGVCRAAPGFAPVCLLAFTASLFSKALDQLGGFQGKNFFHFKAHILKDPSPRPELSAVKCLAV